MTRWSANWPTSATPAPPSPPGRPGARAGDPERARAAAEHHNTYINAAIQEIRDAEARLEVSLRRMGRADLVDVGGRRRKG